MPIMSGRRREAAMAAELKLMRNPAEQALVADHAGTSRRERRM